MYLMVCSRPDIAYAVGVLSCYYTCDIQARNEILVKYVHTSDQLADQLTKALSVDKHTNLIAKFGLYKN